jgi:hypothetical protein
MKYLILALCYTWGLLILKAATIFCGSQRRRSRETSGRECRSAPRNYQTKATTKLCQQPTNAAQKQ